MNEDLIKNNSYKWDVAFSLCKQDVEFARELVKMLNPGIKAFFYEERQEELVSKSGPDIFSKIFAEQSRIVVILSRKGWGESYFTKLEEDAILGRAAKKNVGYGFIIIITMESGEKPSWYPLTRIYSDATKFSIEDLARFIEFKIADAGGDIKPITVEEKHKNLMDRIESKKAIIKLQRSELAVQYAKEEIKNLKIAFNNKIDCLRKGNFNSIEYLGLSEHNNYGYLRIGEFELKCRHSDMTEMYYKLVTTQDFEILFEINKLFGNENSKKPLFAENRLFYYSDNLKGWSLTEIYDFPTESELLVLFRNRDNTKHYDLTRPINTEEWLDIWFQKLLELTSQKIERYL